MDGGPFRAPQPIERRVPSRETVSRPVEEPQPVKEIPKQARRETPLDTSKKPKRSALRRFIFPLIIIVAVLVLGFLAWSAFSKSQNTANTGIDTSKYQAVFFTNGEVYFGKLQSFNDKYMKLTDIFYLQSNATPDSSNTTNSKNNATDSSNAQLIKLGNEVYGPEDEMIISREQVSRYENLKPDSKVVQLINKYLSK